MYNQQDFNAYYFSSLFFFKHVKIDFKVVNIKFRLRHILRLRKRAKSLSHSLIAKGRRRIVDLKSSCSCTKQRSTTTALGYIQPPARYPAPLIFNAILEQRHDETVYRPELFSRWQDSFLQPELSGRFISSSVSSFPRKFNDNYNFVRQKVPQLPT